MDSENGRRRLMVLLGGALALLAGLVIAWLLVRGGRGEKVAAPAASAGGLVIDSSAMEDGKIDPAMPLRCFVAGQFVGELTLAQCAQRNGVATGALDVGVDETGALAAADGLGEVLAPLPPAEEPLPVEAPAAVAAPLTSSAPLGACWRHSDSQWRKNPTEMSLNACVQTLFAGRCERPGGATYGRWGQQTLRLVAGRVEASGDNASFHTLADQGAGCSIPPVG